MIPTPTAPPALPLLDPATLAALPQDTPQTSTEAPTEDTGGGDAPPQTPGGIGMMWPMLIIFAIFYFVMIGPERKARKKREAMLAELKKGDHVVTSSGLHGTVAILAEDLVTLQVDEGVRLRFSRAAIQTVVPREAPAE